MKTYIQHLFNKFVFLIIISYFKIFENNVRYIHTPCYHIYVIIHFLNFLFAATIFDMNTLDT